MTATSRAAALLAAAVASGACASAAHGIRSPARAADAVAEVVLHRVVALRDSADAGADSVVCVARGDDDHRADPDPGFVARFKRDALPVRPWSECALASEPRDRLVHVPTGRPAVGVTVDWPIHLAAWRVVVDASWYGDARDAAGYACAVTYDGAAWSVEECKLRWVL